MDAKLKTDQGRAIVEGKTAVPFKTFVQLVLQRKVIQLFKDWGKDPVIIDSELLTSLASAPGDSQENREQLVMVTLGVGVLAGVFVMSLMQIALAPWDIILTMQHHLMIAGTLVGLAFLTIIIMKIRRKNRSQKIADTMEKIASLVSK